MSSTHFFCFRCGCKGKIRKHATAQGGVKIYPVNCACLLCNSGQRCVYSNIDKCIECRESYYLDKKSLTFICPNNCEIRAVSNYAKRFLSLSAVDINNALPPWKKTLLHSAVGAADVALVWDLLKRGANPFSCDYLGNIFCSYTNSFKFSPRSFSSRSCSLHVTGRGRSQL